VICVIAARGMESQSDQIILPGIINRLGFFIDVVHLPVRRKKCRQIGHGALLELDISGTTDFFDFIAGNGNQQSFFMFPAFPIFDERLVRRFFMLQKSLFETLVTTTLPDRPQKSKTFRGKWLDNFLPMRIIGYEL